jgi:HD superfamily phosphodiesterase
LDTEIDNWIREEEEKWLDLLQQHSSAIFSRTCLPSHDQSHHLRVWKSCKDLLREIAGINSPLDRTLVEGLLVAAWFHDMGMVRKAGKEHGRIGREMCEEFFRSRGLHVPHRFVELLEAIEKHDNKEDSVYDTILPGQPTGILNILSIADDLDAMGITGIYRYSEIYLLRGIPLRKLGLSVLKNGRTRYRNILKSCAHCSPVIRSVRLQHAILEGFFNFYNQQLLVEKRPEQVFTGHLGIVNHIRRLSLAGRIRPEQFPEEMEAPGSPGPGPGETVITYFRSLKDELESGSL